MIEVITVIEQVINYNNVSKVIDLELKLITTKVLIKKQDLINVELIIKEVN